MDRNDRSFLGMGNSFASLFSGGVSIAGYKKSLSDSPKYDSHTTRDQPQAQHFILSNYLSIMETFPATTNELAVTTAKLEDVHISESQIPPSPPSTEDVQTKLTSLLLPQLSEKASIDLPSDAAFKENTARWSDTTFTSPTAVVNVASEADICAVVCPPLFPLPSTPPLTYADQIRNVPQHPLPRPIRLSRVVHVRPETHW